ncbi:MAG: MOSC domain-containing protein [Ignavibacteria bacterium]
MKLVSVNVGTPREIEWNGKILVTSIFKSPVDLRCKVSFTNIEGDEQSDLRVHGGVDKAIYSYDVEYYDYWKKQINRDDWNPGLFGENLTTKGMTDDIVRIGNIYKIGTIKILAVQPRFPCLKLNAKFGMQDMIERFYEQKRHGTYFRVIEEGYIETNNEIELIEESPFNISISDVTFCKVSKGADQGKLREILEHPFIPDNLKEGLRGYLVVES